MFICFDVIHERDGKTDRQTDTAWQHRPRGKNCILYPLTKRFKSGCHKSSATARL